MTDHTAVNAGQRQIFLFAALVLGAVAIASFWKIFLIYDVIWDDNCWLQSIYLTDSVQAFNNTGWTQLHRPTVGGFLYFFIGLHRHTDYFFPVWHVASLITQIASALFIYLFIAELFRNRLLALFTGIAFLVFHLDQSMPYASVMNYRVGLTFSTLSLYLTAKACSEKTSWGLIALAGICALVAHSVFIEPAVALEPGRLGVIAYSLYLRNERGTGLVRKTLTHGSLFLALALPLVVFKLTNKPYGIYEGTYTTNPWFFLDWKPLLSEISDLLFFDWLSFWRLSRYADSFSFLMLPVSVGLFSYLLWKLQDGRLTGKGHDRASVLSTPSPMVAFVLGLLFLLPPLLMVKFAGMDLFLKGTQNNAHAIFGQVGFAMITGHIVTHFFTVISTNRQRKIWGYPLLAGILGIGVYYNNLGLDLYLDSWKRQTLFWQTFVKRFPTLPERADFLFDVADGAPLSDLRIFFDFEVNLNLLYARSTDPAQFRRYRVFSMEEYRGLAIKRGLKQLDDSPIERPTHWGREVLDPKQFTVVLYRYGKILVNQEIAQYVRNYQQLPYSNWIQHRTPELPPETGIYPLRNRLPGF